MIQCFFGPIDKNIIDNSLKKFVFYRNNYTIKGIQKLNYKSLEKYIDTNTDKSMGKEDKKKLQNILSKI